MTKITVLGAGGRIARHAIAALLEEPANELTLYLRRPGAWLTCPPTASR
jgi:dihydrodipicolinate reductase